MLQVADKEIELTSKVPHSAGLRPGVNQNDSTELKKESLLEGIETKKKSGDGAGADALVTPGQDGKAPDGVPPAPKRSFLAGLLCDRGGGKVQDAKRLTQLQD